jgi:hypothetical protein
MAIAKAHGGNITAKSYPGKGSEFTIMLPKCLSPANSILPFSTNIDNFVNKELSHFYSGM